ncbi:hypothetical protein CK203_048807 [Vitis vinifera]|uniref:Ubiquitin-like protease family profile domain-containing protein n=1 Tax=Vitis vinifera TaxID=29760 RepID=A0A438GU75_VITVI|nr:hypothetical protein CK203_048807 [Vitis vinifera]
MAPNLLSPYISQPQTKQSAIRMDLKQALHWYLERIWMLGITYNEKPDVIPYLICRKWLRLSYGWRTKKEVSPYDLRTFNFLTPDVPLQPNEHDCGVFVMKFMELWSMGGFSKSIDVVRRRIIYDYLINGKLKHYRLKIMGSMLFFTIECTPRSCLEGLMGIVICDETV